MKKRVLALLMSLCIVIGLLPCVALATDDDSAWSNNTDTSWYDGNSAPYTISTAAELAGLASLVNTGNSFSGVTINLGANIDLGSKTWTPIGDSTTKFSGTFDGNGCSITGLTNQLFAAVDGATIQNLTVDANIVLTEETDCAAVVNQSYGSTTLKNVTVNGHVEAQAGSAAGLVRKVESGTFVMRNCTNNAEIIGKDRKAAGMIVTTSSGNILMENCVNNGSVSASQTETVSTRSEVYAGGMIAWCQGTVTLQNCKNTGTINGVRTVGSSTGGDSTVACGGLVAVAWYEGTNVTITGCENSGDVTSENQVAAHNAHAGGIVGMCNPYAVVAIYDTVSSGNVTGRCTNDSNTSGVANVGGVVGQLNNSTVTIYNIKISENVNISGSSQSESEDNVGLAVGNRCVGNYAGTLNIGNVIVIDESELPMVGSSANDYTKVTAAIGSNVYTDFSSAISAASNGETVVLLDDIELTEPRNITSSLTIDLNGHDITGTSTRIFHVQSGTLSLTGKGTVSSTHTDDDNFDDRSSVIRVGNGGDSTASSTPTAAGLVIGADVTVSTDWCYGVSVFGSGTTETVDVYGTISVTGNASALSGNGSKQYAGTTINIYEGAVVTSKNNVAIYHPQSGTLAVTGGTISGTSGIEAKAGTVTISGDAEITATKTELSTSGNTDGTSSSGYAVVMLNNSAYAGEPAAAISGGYFIGTVAAADDGDGSSDEESSAEITVSGGHFSESVDPEYLAPSLNAELVSSDSYNETPYSYYTSVEAAQKAASVGDTINDLSSPVSGSEDVCTIVLDYNDEKSAKVAYTVSASSGSISLPSPTRSGYTLSGWSDGTSTYAGGKTYTVPEGVESGATITLTAQWSYNGGGGGGIITYSIAVSSVSNGTVTASRTSASKGTTVTLTVSLDDGYELSSLTVTDANGNVLPLTDKGDGKYVFTMPASKVTVFATFKAATHDCPSEKFTDVDISQYYHEAVDWAVTNGVTVGTSATNFSPNASCTRAQMVTFLWRAAGSPAPATWVNPFTDVESGAYYYDAVLWAVEKGITVGTSATTFSPDATVTRGQTVTFLYRCAGSPAVSGSNSFVDVDSNAYYANAVQWAVTNEVTYGTSTTTFSPENDCTRAQIVTLLYRYIVE